MPGSVSASVFASAQQLEPNPATTSSAARTTCCCALTGSAVTGSGAMWIVPVNVSRATPTTRPMTTTTATGATGIQVKRGTFAVATAVVTPYQARALSSPASAATGRNPAALSCGEIAATADSTTNPPSSQATALAAGSLPHQAGPSPPWLSRIALPSRIGTTARNGPENGTSATPNITVTTGDSTSHTSSVSIAHEANTAPKRGCAMPFGQLRNTNTASTAARAASSPISVSVKPSHDSPNVNSHRRS